MNHRRQGVEAMRLHRPHINVLLLTSDQAEATALQEVLNEHVVLNHVADLGKLERLIESDNYDALFCAWHFQTGTWNDALAEVRRHDPDLPVIVLSRVGMEKEWLEVLTAGAFDLLTPPYRKHGLLSVLEQARASREARERRSVAPPVKQKVGSAGAR